MQHLQSRGCGFESYQWLSVNPLWEFAGEIVTINKQTDKQKHSKQTNNLICNKDKQIVRGFEYIAVINSSPCVGGLHIFVNHYFVGVASRKPFNLWLPY